MYSDLDKKIVEETIVLFDLKNLQNNKFYEYFSVFHFTCEKTRNKPNLSYEEAKAEVKKDIEVMVKEFIQGKKENFYNINEQKSKEIESIFKQIKLKINFNSNPKILNDGAFYTFSEGNFAVYNDKFFNKSLELKSGKEYKFDSVIQLDNKDLIFLAYGQLLIYRPQNGNYVQIQTIDETRAGYKLQNSYSGCFASPKAYIPTFIKKISGNRFICVSNYGYKIYSLNEKNEYSTILIEAYSRGLKMIHELDKTNFIFCSEIFCGASLGGPEHNIIIIDKIQLKEITNNEKIDKLKQTEDTDYYDGDFSYYRGQKPKYITKEDAKRAIESLKLTHVSHQIFEYSQYGKYHNIKSYVVLKNKYFVVCIDNKILIFDLISNEQLRRYQLLIDGKENLFKPGLNLKKWICQEDNEFFICINGNIILFELTNDIELKIINQLYFPEISNLKVLSDKKNSFYDDGKKEDYSIEKSYTIFDKYDEEKEDKKNYIVSIYE